MASLPTICSCMARGFERKPREMSNLRPWDSRRASAAVLDRKACLEGWKFSARKSTVPFNRQGRPPFAPRPVLFSLSYVTLTHLNSALPTASRARVCRPGASASFLPSRLQLPEGITGRETIDDPALEAPRKR